MSLAKAMARAWTDADYKEKLLSDPRAALAEAGVDVRAGVKVKVVENDMDTQYLVLPAAPAQAGEMSESELESVAAGTEPYANVVQNPGY